MNCKVIDELTATKNERTQRTTDYNYVKSLTSLPKPNDKFTISITVGNPIIFKNSNPNLGIIYMCIRSPVKLLLKLLCSKLSSFIFTNLQFMGFGFWIEKGSFEKPRNIKNIHMHSIRPQHNHFVATKKYERNKKTKNLWSNKDKKY